MSFLRNSRYLKSVFISLTVVTVQIFLGAPAAEAIDAGDVGQSAGPVDTKKKYNQESRNEKLRKAEQANTISPAQNRPGVGSDHSFGFGMGSAPTQMQAKQVNSDLAGGGSGAGNFSAPTIEVTNTDIGKTFGTYTQFSRTTGASAGPLDAYLSRKQEIKPLQMGTPGDDILAGGPFVSGGSGAGGGGSCGPSGCSAIPGQNVSNKIGALAAGHGVGVDTAMKSDPASQVNQARANALQNMACSASNAGEDALECLINALDGMSIHLINVANEDAGSPCGAFAISKTYSNAVYMVQKMYKACFLPMVLLFLVPGALMTNTKTMIQFGLLKGGDEDTVSPFTGILRSMIAIFLIPATQLIVSYMVDIGNSLQAACMPYVNTPLIVLWAEEQVQIFKSDQQGNPIKNLPNVAMAPWRGKFAGMPIKGAIMEQVSGMDAALSELSNECLHLLSEGLTITHAFQVVMICYLFLLGPLAAAFFAWPGVGRDLFRKAFSSWVDGVVILSLWKFWWNIVLIVMTIRCESGALNPFDPFEVYYLVAFCCILMFVPFNPFDFKPGEIVSHALEKAQSVAAKVAQGGKGGGSGEGGGSCGKAGKAMGV